MPGIGKRISYAFKSFFAILSSGALPPDVADELTEPKAEAAAPAPAPAPPNAEPEPKPERAAPPVERPNSAVTPPVAAPSPNPKHTPPKGQPAVPPRPAPTPVAAVAAVEPPQSAPVVSGDAAIFNQAQRTVTTQQDADEDPFFAELRAAMQDQSPLGPRDDDEFAG